VVPTPCLPGCSWAESDAHAVLSTHDVRFGFTRFADRWTHALALAEDDEREIVRAVETQPEHASPERISSPLYQELCRHDRAGDSSLWLLLTGHLFAHHFSAAVNLHIEPGRPNRLVIDFDVADRCRSGVETLVATYQVALHPGTLVWCAPDRIAWSPVRPDRGRLELLAESPTRLVMDQPGPSVTLVQAVAKIEPATFTQRLRYRWRWTSCSGDVTR
jgi:hypothetical protein